MKRTIFILTFLLVPLSLVAGKTFAQDIISASPQVGSVSQLNVENNSDTACAGGIIHDDGTPEDSIKEIVNPTIFVDPFDAADFPAGIKEICICFTASPSGGVNPELDFKIVIYDDDGPGGQPGTELASIPVSATNLPPFPDFMFYDFTVSGQNINLPSDGNIYIGPEWDGDQNALICIDSNQSTPQLNGFFSNDSGLTWATLTIFTEYRALLVRAVPKPLPLSIPALSQWGLIAMVGILGIAGFMVIRRKKASA